MDAKDILIVDDDENMNFALCETLRRQRYRVDSADSYLGAVEKLRFQRYPLVITDVRMPDGNGLNLIGRIKADSPDTGVLVMTAFGTIEDAVKALKSGAADYILKPFPAEEIIRLVTDHFPTRFNPRSSRTMICSDPQMISMTNRARKAAQSDVSILIQGESGTGKEILARFIHQNSPRKDGPYLAVNCAAIPDNLLESELFGHERGAFTGAEKMKPGKFELAESGTLVLDEIGDMPLTLQAKILRALQEAEIDRLGGGAPIPINVRVIAITNQEIRKLIAQGKFREDLYYRLNVVEFVVPPLRTRPLEIDEIARSVLENLNQSLPPPGKRFSDKAMQRLLGYPWPGNVRELQNVVQRAAIFAEGTLIEGDDIEFSGPAVTPAPSSLELKTIDAMEQDMITRALVQTENNKTRAAEILGISVRTLRNKLAEYRLQGDSFPDDGD
jgi:two-component system response regulator FlrC